MKWTKTDTRFAVIAIMMLLLFFWLVATGCSSSKHVEKSFTDSTATKDDSIRLLKSERDLFEQQYNELLYASVLFDTILSHDTIHNTVYITKEGEVKAEGNIRSVAVSKNVYLNLISQKDRTIDSLSKIKEKVRVVTETKQVEKKTTVLPWWFIVIISGVFVIVKKLKFI